MIKVKSFTFNPFQENTYLLYDDTLEAVVIDPGCNEMEEKKELSDFISLNQLKVKLLLNTHCHIDHVLGNDFVKSRYQVPFKIHPLDLPVLKSVKSYASNYGFPLYQEATPDAELREGSPVNFGNSSLQVIFLPGHAPGHVGFYSDVDNFIIAGDVLFFHSVGRTDLPGGNHETLLARIHQNLFILPDEIIVYPGHGPATNIGEEKMNNPFCAITV